MQSFSVALGFCQFAFRPRPPGAEFVQVDPMRLDLFLKWSRVILRRTLAKEMCDAGRVTVNGQEARAGRDVHLGDTISVRMPRRRISFRVRSIPDHAPGKEGAREMIELIASEEC